MKTWRQNYAPWLDISWFRKTLTKFETEFKKFKINLVLRGMASLLESENAKFSSEISQRSLHEHKLSTTKQNRLIVESAFYLRITCILSSDGFFFYHFHLTDGIFPFTWHRCVNSHLGYAIFNLNKVGLLKIVFYSHTLGCGYRKEGV